MRDAFAVDGPAGVLQVRAHGPLDGDPPVLLCHPHPLHGGSMGSRLVYDLAKGLAEEGFRTFRFDYRGVGASEGAYGRGVGEADDAVAVFDWVQGRHRLPPVVIGHSFGGGVALQVARRRAPAMAILIGTPARVSESDLDVVADAPHVTCPVLQLRGTEDEHVPREDVAAVDEALRDGTVVELRGAGHFLEPSRNQDALRAVLSALAPVRGRATS